MATHLSAVGISYPEAITFPPTFSGWLKLRRQALNLTQTELAEAICCTVSALRKIESGERRPSKQLAELLAQSLQISSEAQATFIRVARGELGVERLVAPADLPATDLQPAEKPALLRGNLPRSLTPFIGRETERTEIGKLLRDPGCSLLTLVGPGGVGKTRLALQVGNDLLEVFSDGVYFVSLASIDKISLAPAVISVALQISLSAKLDPIRELLEVLANQELLLILDNLEHLQGVAGFIQEILARAPKLTLLATSRERLKLAGEWIFPVEGLPTSSPGLPCIKSVSASSDLFIQNARRLQPDFHPDSIQQEAIEQICWLLEGLPLAIELAASWVQLLPCTEIAGEIQRDLDFLAEDRPGVPPRHASMRVVFDHSWKSLSLEERAVYRRLSVFKGSFEREAAQAVAGASLSHLRLLLDKSLIRRTSSNRYDLHELARQYAYEQLVNAGEEKGVHDQALRYCLDLAESAVKEIRDEGNLEWMHRLDEELENLRTALEWAISSHQVELGIRLSWALFRLWYWYNHHIQETRHWLGALLAAAKGKRDLSSELMGNLLYETGVIATLQMDLPSAEAHLTRSLSHYHSISDKHGQAAALGSLGVVASRYEDLAKARSYFLASLALKRELGENISAQLNNLGMEAYYQGDYSQAKVYFEDALQHQPESYNLNWKALILCSLAGAELQLGERLSAIAHYFESLREEQELGNKEVIAYAVEGLAGCYTTGEPGESDPYLAARLFGAADALRKAIAFPLSPPEARINQHFIQQIKTALGDITYQAAWQDGQAISIDALVQDILNSGDS
jgi:predicted ATPase/transcriptional regulator with XRE-family HTH domain